MGVTSSAVKLENLDAWLQQNGTQATFSINVL